MTKTDYRIRRLYKELALFKTQPCENCSVRVIDDDITTWNAVILGPHDTPYENGIFELNIVFPPRYPFVPPICKFTTRLYHPNIDHTGYICSDVFDKNNWSPGLTVMGLLVGICSLLNEPNVDDAVEPAIADLYTTDFDMYYKTVKKHVCFYSS